MARSLERLPARGDGGSVMVVVETPRGSASKFKYVAELEAVMLFATAAGRGRLSA
jgi:hypothetical protein